MEKQTSDIHNLQKPAQEITSSNTVNHPGPARESNMHPQPVIQDAWLLVTCLPASPRQQAPEKAPVACEVGKLDTVVSRRSEVTEQQLSVSKATRPPNGRTGTGVWISAVPPRLTSSGPSAKSPQLAAAATARTTMGSQAPLAARAHRH
ncbi:uncharacterized protein LOC144617185 [Panthera onca]